MGTLAFCVEVTLGIASPDVVGRRMNTETNSLSMLAQKLGDPVCLSAFSRAVKSVNYYKLQAINLPPEIEKL